VCECWLVHLVATLIYLFDTHSVLFSVHVLVLFFETDARLLKKKKKRTELKADTDEGLTVFIR